MGQYSNQKDANLIALQLENEELLQKLERFYSGDHFVQNGDNINLVKQTNKDLITFNEFGVNLMMEVVSKYIDKNTVLSLYTEERINEILADLGDELALVVYCNYEKMGMDTAFKKSKFRMVIVTTLHVIESAYRRSIEGKTSENVNQSKIVTQSDSLNRLPPIQPQRKKYSILDPRSWGA